MFEVERRSRAYYERRARNYDLANRVSAFLRGASPTKERHKAVRRLGLQPGQRVLEVSVGTGTNLPFIAKRVGGDGRIVGLDISRGMLGVCRRKMRDKGIVADLIEGEAGHLPFPDEAFDAVFHHGGIAEFGDRGAAIAEMYRVVRPGGPVVVCDVGRPTDRKMSLVNRFLMRFQPEYDKPPPVEAVPETAEDVDLRWYFKGSWYMLAFKKPTA
jgi:ubiquinone/menaquinone biosynthesis C-methylase UbiE